MNRDFKNIFLIVLSFLPFFYSIGEENAERPGFRIDCSQIYNADGTLKAGWLYRGKVGIKGADFITVSLHGKKVLKVQSCSGSGNLLRDLSGLDLKKYPYMRWKWRADILPFKADVRKKKDDQAIALYLGTGTTVAQRTVAFRWETLTPKGCTGSLKYALGSVQVYWTCIRNHEDKRKQWYIEECNVYELVRRKLFRGAEPHGRFVLTISTNSQYTNSTSLAYLEYVEFHSHPMEKPKEQTGEK